MTDLVIVGALIVITIIGVAAASWIACLIYNALVIVFDFFMGIIERAVRFDP